MNTNGDLQQTSILPHVAAWVLFVVTAPLVFLGGLVTTKQAGMAVPDWPSTYGYNLFLYPWQTWLFGPLDLLIEHGHRLLGAVAGLASLVLLILSFRHSVAAWVRPLSVAAVVLVIVQGILGGMRVRFDSRTFAQIHGIVGPTFLAVTASLVAASSRPWHAARLRCASDIAVQRAASLLRDKSALLVILAMLQLLLGSFLRHLPLGMNWRQFQIVTYFHVLGAAAVAICTIAFWIQTIFATQPDSYLRSSAHRLGSLLMTMLLAQVSLGALTWLYNYGLPDLGPTMNAWVGESFQSFVVITESMAQSLITTAHQALGGMFIAISVATYTVLSSGTPARRWNNAANVGSSKSDACLHFSASAPVLHGASS